MGRVRELLSGLSPFDISRVGQDFYLARKEWDPVPRKKAIGEFWLKHHLRELLDTLHISTVLDVGANRGQYAELLRSIGYTGHIISFEPVPHLYQTLCNKAENDNKWMVQPYALGDTNTEATLNAASADSLSSFKPPSDFGKSRYGYDRGDPALQGEKIEVPVKRLDTVLPELPIQEEAEPIFLKLDTQGYDKECFDGLGSFVEHIAVLQTEIPFLHIYDDVPHFAELIQHYEAAGFGITGIFPITFDDETSHIIEADCVMVRA